MFTDKQLEGFWEDFADTPITEEDEIDADFIISENVWWSKGEDRFEIWHWFDAHYSRGVAVLSGCA